MAHYIVQFTKGGATLKIGLTRQARDLLRRGLWGVPPTAQLKMQPRPGAGVLVAVGAPDRVFVGDAVVASGYHRFNDDEAARFPSTLRYDHGLSLTQVRVWPRPLPVMAVWPKTAAAVSNPGALWFGTLNEIPSTDAASITAIGIRSERMASEDQYAGTSYDTNTPLSDQERAQILAFLERGLSSSEIAGRLGIPVMRVAAVKAHATMGTYGDRPRDYGHRDGPVDDRPRADRTRAEGVWDTDRERNEILALLRRGLPSSRIAQRLGISTMRVAAIKAHITMGTYSRYPAGGPRPNAPATGRQSAVSRGAGSARFSLDPTRSSAAAPQVTSATASSPAPASVGIDVAESRKGLDLVALDRERSIATAQSRLTVDEVVEAVLSLRPTVVCIDAPSGWARAGKSRLAERQLATLGIQAYYTGQDPGDHPFYAWIRVGMQIYERLADEFPLYRGGEVTGHAAEIFPHASAVLLANSLPARRPKEPFRRKVLRDHNVAEEDLRTLDLVDAALAALTGLIALDGDHSSVGDPDEGVILLPLGTLPFTALQASGRSTFGPTRRSSAKVRAHPQGETVQIDYVNRNDQRVIAATGLPGTDHGQSIYVLRCERCRHEYGSNGSDNFQRKCPRCQGGRPGLQYPGTQSLLT